MEFYAKRTVGEQAQRLPPDFRPIYENSQLDRIEIDGCEIHGYFEYSFMEEKTYHEQPVRSQNGEIVDLEDYTTFLTPRLIIKYNMMGIDDYRTLMTFLKTKNTFKVTCYDIVADRRVTHEMYFATPSMPMIYQKYLAVLGIREPSIELIGTNRRIEEEKINLTIGYEDYIAYINDDWLSFTLNQDTGFKVEYSTVLKRFIVTKDGGTSAVYDPLNTFVYPHDYVEGDCEYWIKRVA